MNETPEYEVGRLLAEAVPPLREPEDRIGEVRRRVRRARWRAATTTTVAAIAVLAGLAVAVPRLVAGDDAPPPASNPADCPTWSRPSGEDTPGPLVRNGAVDATLCRPDSPPMLLTTGMDRLVAALNELVHTNPEEVACTLLPIDNGPSLVLRYPDGSSTAVFVDYNCGGVMADGRTRYGDPLSTFRELHRAQLAAETDPATIPTPQCPETLPPIDMDSGPRDTIDRYGVPYTDDPPLPSPLVAAVSCRYVPDRDGGGRLVTSSEDRGDLTALWHAVNATFDEATLEHSSCASAIDTMGAALPDLLVVADATGQSAEVWVFSTAAGAPCLAAFFGPPAMRPKPELVAYLDRMLS
jgi:hypothetical protein